MNIRKASLLFSDSTDKCEREKENCEGSAM